MWCERIIRNCGDPYDPHWADQWAGRSVDWVDVEWSDCGRVLKKQTRSGEPIRVLLPPGQRLRHNDVIYEDEVQSIAIHVVPCELIVAKITDSRKLALLALEIGNLHLPAQVEKDEIAFIEDGPVMEVLDTMQIPWTKQHRRFDPAQVISVPSVDLSPALRTIIRSQPQTPRGLAAPAGSPPGANERP